MAIIRRTSEYQIHMYQFPDRVGVDLTHRPSLGHSRLAEEDLKRVSQLLRDWILRTEVTVFLDCLAVFCIIRYSSSWIFLTMPSKLWWYSLFDRV